MTTAKILVHAATDLPIAIGDKCRTFRGETVEVTGMREPHHEGSTGRVYVKDEDGHTGEYFPGVIDAKWIDA